LTQSILNLASGPGTMSAEMIRNKSVYIGDSRWHMLNGIDPGIDLPAAIDLHAGEVDEIAIGSHPPDVHKVRGRPASEREHHFPRNPAAIGKREADVAVAKKCDDSFRNPPAVTELDTESKIWRKISDEVDQSRQLVRLEVRPELNENRSELLLELPRSLVKLFADAQ